MSRKERKTRTTSMPGMTAAEIIESWDNKSAESRRYGSLADEYTEQRFEKTPGRDGNLEVGQ